jgi:hypothetical protein
MLFDRLRLTVNLKNASVELFNCKAEFVSLCNETNVTLSDRQKSPRDRKLNGLVRDLRESIEHLQQAKGELEDKLHGATLQIVKQNDLLKVSTHDKKM